MDIRTYRAAGQPIRSHCTSLLFPITNNCRHISRLITKQKHASPSLHAAAGGREIVWTTLPGWLVLSTRCRLARVIQFKQPWVAMISSSIIFSSNDMRHIFWKFRHFFVPLAGSLESRPSCFDTGVYTVQCTVGRQADLETLISKCYFSWYTFLIFNRKIVSSWAYHGGVKSRSAALITDRRY